VPIKRLIVQRSKKYSPTSWFIQNQRVIWNDLQLKFHKALRQMIRSI
jgi:hypothetical protein